MGYTIEDLFPNGKGYTITDGFNGGSVGSFVVTDDEQARFWTEFQRYGGSVCGRRRSGCQAFDFSSAKVAGVNAVLPSAADKPGYVAAMFGRIAPRYDLMNTLMTGGQDTRWRRIVAESLTLGDTAEILDVGTGTGKLAEAVGRAVPRARVIGVDFTLPMLRQAQHDLLFAGADALRLPFADAQFDAVVSGFVIRNLADVPAGIAEQARVLRPGGQLIVLETTPGPPNLWRPLFRLYFRRLVPLLGHLIAGDESAYTYLPESTLAFLEPGRLALVLRENGLVDVRVRRLAFGSVAVTHARKPSATLA